MLVDTHIMNTPGFGAVLFKACEELGVTCVTEQLVIPYTIMWKREVTECSMSSETQVRHELWMRWIEDFQFYVLFNSISVISG